MGIDRAAEFFTDFYLPAADTSRDLVENAYETFLGLSGDFDQADERIDYWTGRLNSDLSEQDFADQFLDQAQNSQGSIISDAAFDANQNAVTVVGDEAPPEGTDVAAAVSSIGQAVSSQVSRPDADPDAPADENGDIPDDIQDPFEDVDLDTDLDDLLGDFDFQFAPEDFDDIDGFEGDDLPDDWPDNGAIGPDDLLALLFFADMEEMFDPDQFDDFDDPDMTLPAQPDESDFQDFATAWEDAFADLEDVGQEGFLEAYMGFIFQYQQALAAMWDGIDDPVM